MPAADLKWTPGAIVCFRAYPWPDWREAARIDAAILRFAEQGKGRAVDEQDRVFEAMIGGTRQGHYHGYPIRRGDPLHAEILAAWKDDDDATG